MWSRRTREGLTGYEPKVYDYILRQLRRSLRSFVFFVSHDTKNHAATPS
jgi:hypothetical protein